MKFSISFQTKNDETYSKKYECNLWVLKEIIEKLYKFNNFVKWGI